MAISQYENLLNFLKEKPIKKQEVIQNLSDINEATIKFLAFVLMYCESSMNEINNKDKKISQSKIILIDAEIFETVS